MAKNSYDLTVDMAAVTTARIAATNSNWRVFYTARQDRRAEVRRAMNLAKENLHQEYLRATSWS